MASDLKKKKVERTTGKCPMGCGRPIPNGGQALVLHLGVCGGRSKRS